MHLKSGSMIFWNCAGSMTSRISSTSPRNITSFWLQVLGHSFSKPFITWYIGNTHTHHYHLEKQVGTHTLSHPPTLSLLQHARTCTHTHTHTQAHTHTHTHTRTQLIFAPVILWARRKLWENPVHFSSIFSKLPSLQQLGKAIFD